MRTIDEKNESALIDGAISQLAFALMRVKFLAESCADKEDELEAFYKKFRDRFTTLDNDEAKLTFSNLSGIQKAKFGKTLQELSSAIPISDEPKAEAIVEPKIEPKVEPKIEPKVEKKSNK